MKTMSKHGKRIMMVLAISLLSMGILLAQPFNHRGSRGPQEMDSAQMVRMVDRLTNKLSLTAEQKAKITVIHQKHAAAIKAKMEALHNDIQKEQLDAQTEIKAVLDTKQNAQFDTITSKREDRMDKMRDFRFMRHNERPSCNCSCCDKPEHDGKQPKHKDIQKDK